MFAESGSATDAISGWAQRCAKHSVQPVGLQAGLLLPPHCTPQASYSQECIELPYVGAGNSRFWILRQSSRRSPRDVKIFWVPITWPPRRIVGTLPSGLRKTILCLPLRNKHSQDVSQNFNFRWNQVYKMLSKNKSRARGQLTLIIYRNHIIKWVLFLCPSVRVRQPFSNKIGKK